MAARTGLKENLQEISALIGLLRSDLVELSDRSLDGARRAPVMSHMRWIADRFDALAPELSTDTARPVRQRTKTAKATKVTKPAQRKAPSEKAGASDGNDAAAPSPVEAPRTAPPGADQQSRPAQPDAAPAELPAANDSREP